MKYSLILAIMLIACAKPKDNYYAVPTDVPPPVSCQDQYNAGYQDGYSAGISDITKTIHSHKNKDKNK